MSLQKDQKTNIFMRKMVLILGVSIALGAGGSFSPGLPVILAEFAGTPNAAFWVSMIVTLPALFVVIGGPISGYLADRVGRKPLLVFSLLLGGISGCSGVFLDTLTPLLVSRAVVGLSMAGITTATNALIADYFTGQQRSNLMGLQSAFLGLSVVVFLPLGGFLADIDWHYAFLSYAPLLLLFPLALISIYEPVKISHQDVDVKETRLNLNSVKIYILVSVFIFQFAFITLPVFLAYFLGALLNTGGTQVGLLSAVSGLFSFISGLLYGRIIRGVGFKYMAVASFLLTGAGFLILGLGTSWFAVVIGLILLGICLGAVTANLNTWLADQFSIHVRGRANGIFVTLFYLGQFVSPFLFTPIANIKSYSFIYLLCAGIVSILGLAALFVQPNAAVLSE